MEENEVNGELTPVENDEVKEPPKDQICDDSGEKCDAPPPQEEISAASTPSKSDFIKTLTLTRNQIILIPVLAFVALVAVFFIGSYAGHEKEIDNTVLANVQAMDARYTGVKDKLNAIKEEYNTEYAKYNDYKNYKTHAAELTKDLSSAQEKLGALQKEVSAKQAELDKITANVTKAAGAPLSLPAGMYTVGTHIPPGRYKVTGSSNFIVHEASGYGYINTILGGRYGVAEYIADLKPGMTMELSGKDTFTPVS